MDFRLSPETEELRLRIRRFVREEILPLEADASTFDEHENIRLDLLDTLRRKAKAEGLFSLQTPKELGGEGSSSRWPPATRR